MAAATAAAIAGSAPLPIAQPTIAAGTTAASVLTGELRHQIDGIWNAFWSGGIANPLEVLEQLTYLLFIRRSCSPWWSTCSMRCRWPTATPRATSTKGLLRNPEPLQGS
ncbi:type I restriction-modification system subunit M N-terminal domain-containing protein [Synechococcus sp. CS-1328]|uniref:type I restriction-modification system subunit M N-terminal domain-containing protein n=1 Tax=Synechococcus sp. CS-1328 TaxID=2847976 RepID=UPI00223A745A|nr:type I restriction-modification system subunit M N-terminal domain-containing protein [Synechococcus sp. CS-1328]MCT0226506.1 type I restriction-modification system subunit M N-terminal domain-containing protein [Synechococcus sp. CS-1328]